MKTHTSFLCVSLFFVVNSAQADLSINPPISEVGTSVVIGGSVFDLAPVNNQITFTGKSRPVPAEWVSEDGKYLLVRVPKGTTDGPITVSVRNRHVGNTAFKVKLPTTLPSLFVWLGIG